MTISEALLSINPFPIQDTTIERICIDRELDKDEDYTAIIGVSEAYELATADTYMYLAFQPSIVEQEVGINQAIAVKKRFFDLANAIYGRLDDDKFNGTDYGFVGEDYNG